MHVEFACWMHSQLQVPLPSEEIISIAKDAVALEKLFRKDAFSKRLLGLNNDTMESCIEFVSDKLLSMLDCPKVSC